MTDVRPRGGVEHGYLLRVSRRQARLIQSALDLVSRLHMGQLREVADFLPAIRSDGDERIRQHHAAESLLEAVKEVVFPELPRNGYHGIHSPKIPEDARVAWDLCRAIRHRLAWEERPEGDAWQVDFDQPRRSSVDEPLATFTAEAQRVAP